MTYDVTISENALDDLTSFQLWIEGEAGREIADGYLARITKRLQSLNAFPNRGTPREDIAAGLRSLSFERRVVILYRVEAQSVTILRIVSAARELGSVVG